MWRPHCPAGQGSSQEVVAPEGPAQPAPGLAPGLVCPLPQGHLISQGSSDRVVTPGTLPCWPQAPVRTCAHLYSPVRTCTHLCTPVRRLIPLPPSSASSALVLRCLEGSAVPPTSSLPAPRAVTAPRTAPELLASPLVGLRTLSPLTSDWLLGPSGWTMAIRLRWRDGTS